MMIAVVASTTASALSDDPCRELWSGEPVEKLEPAPAGRRTSRMYSWEQRQAKADIDKLYAWQFHGPFLRDFAGNAPVGRRDAGALEKAAKEPPAVKLPALWEYTPPLITPEKREHDPSRAQKDPTVVFHRGKWHVFMTVKLPGRSAIEHCAFKRWEDADRSKRTILKVSDSDYYCAPEVFYFAPHEKWYLIYQMGVPGAKFMWVAYSSTRTIDDPNSWTKARPILDGGKNDPREVGGLDYWIICDDRRAYLFLTSLNGKMWRLWTKLEDFPRGFGDCQLALQAKIFEASHTYRLKGTDKYLTIVEENGRRYYKAYMADRLDGEWKPLADTAEKPFAGWKNIRPAPGVDAWTDNVSHGELIRDGCDQNLIVDPNNLQFLFQGMLDRDKARKGYGQFQWRLGILRAVKARTGNGPGRHEKAALRSGPSERADRR